MGAAACFYNLINHATSGIKENILAAQADESCGGVSSRIGPWTTGAEKQDLRGLTLRLHSFWQRNADKAIDPWPRRITASVRCHTSSSRGATKLERHNGRP
jgi:hypothetical protein